MASLVALGTNFDLGFQSDTSRDELSARAAYRMRDYIPQLEAPLRKRGGWGFGSPDLGTLGGSANSVASLGYLPFPGDGHLVAVSDAGSVYQLKQFDGSGGANITADTGDTSIVPTWPIFWHKTGTVYYGIILGGLGQSFKVPKRYSDSGGGVYVVAPLTGTPPMARAGFSWGDYLVLLNYYDPTDSNTLKNYRWAFSGVGNPNEWTLTGASASTFDFPEETVAGVPVLTSILAFGYENCHILTGDVPPPGGNLTRKILWAGVGTFDGRSCLAWKSNAIWANSAGVWQSDGASLTNLTSSGGISLYYQSLVRGFSVANGWSASAGLYRDHYVITIFDQDNALVTTLACDLERRVWTEWTNIPAVLFARRSAGPGTALFGGDEELFFAHRTLPRVGTISSLWTPNAAFASDADGMAVLPDLETPFYRIGSLGEKRIRRVYVGYDLRSTGNAPTLDLSYTLSPEVDAAYVDMRSLPASARFARKRSHLGRHNLGVGLKIGQTAASADTRIFSVETDSRAWEDSR